MKEDLIIAVQSRPALWDKRHKNHHNRHLLEKEWKAVAAELHSTDKEVKLFWKNIRDEFRKQINKTSRSGDAAPESTTSWKYFEAMLFLRDQFVPRKSTGNLTVQGNDEDNVAINDEGHLSESLLEEYDNSPSIINDAACDDLTEISTPITTAKNSTIQPTSAVKRCTEEYTRTGFKRRLTMRAKIGQKLISLEKEKLKIKINQLEGCKKNDEDVAFFNSLLLTVKSLDPRKKMLFRMKVQHTLFDLAFPTEDEPFESVQPLNQQFENDHQLHYSETSSSTTSPITNGHYNNIPL